MAKFVRKITLTPKEKEFVLQYIKPLLKENNMDKVRYFLNEWLNDAIEPNLQLKRQEAHHIEEFLLSIVGEESYFSGDDEIHLEEFSYCENLVEIEIPAHINFIPDLTFIECKNLRVVKISPQCKDITFDSNAFMINAYIGSTDHCKVLVPRGCQLKIWIYDEDYETWLWDEFIESKFKDEEIIDKVEFY